MTLESKKKMDNGIGRQKTSLKEKLKLNNV